MHSPRAWAIVPGIALGLVGLAALPAAGTPDGGPDFGADPAANFAAFLVSEDVAAALGADPGVVGQRITPTGIEISVTGEPTDEQRAAAAAVASSEASTLAAGGADPAVERVPITFRVVPNSRASLDDLTSRLLADAPSWSARGIVFSSWGPDLDHDVVGLRLQAYAPKAARALEATYGPLLQVSATSETAVGAGPGADVSEPPAAATLRTFWTAP
jgi:hypothetical protein